MPIDYSKWNSLSLEDSDGEGPAPPPAKAEPAPPAAAPPSSSGGGSYHWQEKDHGKWGKARLKALLDKARVAAPFAHEANEYTANVTLTITSLEGDAWTHLRKGKLKTGYDFTFTVTFAGTVDGSGGSNRWPCQGKLENYDLAMGELANPDYVFSCFQQFPFRSSLEAAVVSKVKAQCKVFVGDLERRAGPAPAQAAVAPVVQVGQYEKYQGEGVADGVSTCATCGRRARRGRGLTKTKRSPRCRRRRASTRSGPRRPAGPGRSCTQTCKLTKHTDDAQKESLVTQTNT